MDTERDLQSRTRLAVILFTVAANIIAVWVFARVPWSDWRTGLALSLFDNAVFLTYLWVRRDRLLGRLMLFGLVVGITELVADAWLVSVVQTLDYSIGDGPMLWRSPIRMPLAWEVVAVQFGCIGTALMEKWPTNGLLVAGLLGALTIPFYDAMAVHTRWWQYRNCKMFLHTPYFVVLGEFAIVLCITLGARIVKRGTMGPALNSGVIVGAGIFISYAVAYWLTESG